MNKFLTVLCLIMLIIAFILVIGTIVHGFYDVAALLMMISFVFAKLLGIQLRNGGKR